MVAGDDLVGAREQTWELWTPIGIRGRECLGERTLIECQETDTPRERLRRRLQRFVQECAVAHQETLRALAQSKVDQWSVVAPCGKEVGGHAEHGPPRAGVRALQQGDDLPHA